MARKITVQELMIALLAFDEQAEIDVYDSGYGSGVICADDEIVYDALKGIPIETIVLGESTPTTSPPPEYLRMDIPYNGVLFRDAPVIVMGRRMR